MILTSLLLCTPEVDRVLAAWPLVRDLPEASQDRTWRSLAGVRAADFARAVELVFHAGMIDESGELAPEVVAYLQMRTRERLESPKPKATRAR